jgi:hypothetical protein
MRRDPTSGSSQASADTFDAFSRTVITSPYEEAVNLTHYQIDAAGNSRLWHIHCKKKTI